MQLNDLISKQSVLIFLVLGAYLRAILALMQYMQTDLNRACSAEIAGQNCEVNTTPGESPHKQDAGQFFGGAPCVEWDEGHSMDLNEQQLSDVDDHLGILRHLKHLVYPETGHDS